MFGSSKGPDITKALSDNPDALKTWLKLQRKSGDTDSGKPAEAMVKGATKDSIAAYAAGSKANQLAQPKSSKRKRRWLRRRR